MNFPGFPVTGWKTRTIPVARRAGTPAVLVLRSRGPMTSFSVTPVMDTPAIKERGGHLFDSFGTDPHMFVLPTRYTHVEIARPKREAGNGIARWTLDRVAAEDLRVLDKSVTGVGSEVFAWRNAQGRFRFDFNHKDAHRTTKINFYALSDGEESLMDIEGHTRGTATVPEPGFVRIQSSGTWRIDLT